MKLKISNDNSLYNVLVKVLGGHVIQGTCLHVMKRAPLVFRWSMAADNIFYLINFYDLLILLMMVITNELA